MAAEEDTALMRALGLAHHWQRLLDERRVESVARIAEAAGVDVTQVRRLMRLTRLAPEFLERMEKSTYVALEKVMRRPWPSNWVAHKQGLSETMKCPSSGARLEAHLHREAMSLPPP